jgi:transcriptional regulator with XRE-family HTH domain
MSNTFWAHSKPPIDFGLEGTVGRRPVETIEESVFAKRLREIRKRRGLTQAELAQKLGLQQSMIAQYERGYIRVHAATLIVRLAAALQVTPNELLGTEDIRTEDVLKSRSLLRRLKQVNQLPAADQKALIRFLDALFARHQAPRPIKPSSASTPSDVPRSHQKRRLKVARRSRSLP